MLFSFDELLKERYESGVEFIKIRESLDPKVNWTNWVKKNIDFGYATVYLNIRIVQNWDRIKVAVQSGKVKNFTQLYLFLRKESFEKVTNGNT